MIFLWLNKRDWRTPGPIVNMAVHNAHALAALGHETHLLVAAGAAQSHIGPDLIDFYGLDARDELHVHRIQRWEVGRSRLALPVFLHAYRAVQRLASRDEITVVTRDATFLPLLARLVRNPRIKGFFEAHDLYADLSWRTNRVKIGDRRQGWLERKFLPRISGLICLTEAQRDLYRKVLPQVKSIALPLGTKEFPAVDSEERRKRRTIAYTGRLTSEKGTKLLLRAVPELARRDIRVAFFGGWPEQIAVQRERLQTQGLAEFVDFDEFRAPADYHRALAAKASLGVVALQDTFYNRYLTCPVKALDYLSHGLPVIGSDLPSIREVAGEAAAYVAPEDAASVVANAVKLLDDPDVYRRASELSLRRSSELLWRKRAAKIAEFARAV